MTSMAHQAVRKSMAGTLRRLYEERISTPDCRNKLSAKNADIKIWSAIADTCIELKADPTEMMQALHEYAQVKGISKMPFVSQLSENVLRIAWNNYAKQRVFGTEQEIHDVAMPAVVEWNEHLSSTAEYLIRNVGTCNPGDPKVIEELRLRISGIFPYVRCVLTDDPEVWRLFQPEAKAYLIDKPALCAAIKASGFQTDRILCS